MIKNQSGFTLVELLVVMSIIGVLVTIVAGGFRSSQIRGRDAERKADLREIANALELFYSDYGKYPDASGTQIAACAYDPVADSGTACTWGDDEFTDSKTVYFKELPEDPSSAYDYVYRIVPSSSNQKFQLFARIENTRDPDCVGGDCSTSPLTISCGSEVCNFATTSSNTTALE
jgi:general secretion pathway protein G